MKKIPLVFPTLLFLWSMQACQNADATKAGPNNPNVAMQQAADSAGKDTTQPVAKIKMANVKPGKYGCTNSKYTGSGYEYQPKGFVTLTQNGQYIYEGFKEPSQGTFTVDEKGNLLFNGGYLANGIAEKINRPNKYFLTFPSNPDNRWTMGLVE